ncbi:MAG: peptide-methionine (S)-S-oxide reductase MsrA [Planctomycetes bacterium]|nr:peptide-methionine (S)-S-oxide reductase MsrA [Planctomycetota bacterium]
MPTTRLPSLLLALLGAAACSQPETPGATPPASPPPAPAVAMPTDPPAPAPQPSPVRELATFGSGCFWCTEAVLEQLDGVLEVTSGYAGGEVENPTYEQVCSGTTGHAEVVQIVFDPARISYAQLLDWFFRAHDPTTLDRQGPDHGTQYRSVVFTHSAAQQAEAQAAIARAQPHWRDPIVTEVAPAPRFWPAEGYHQDYFRRNPNQGYCRVMIAPKLQKLGLEPKPGR